jgi:hypothetical protein
MISEPSVSEDGLDTSPEVAVAEELILPVPNVLSALYLVPSALTSEAAREQALAALPDPGTILANSADDASVDESIRAGRPIVIDAGTVVDWAVWEDGEGIVEGGETNKVALREGIRGKGDDA